MNAEVLAFTAIACAVIAIGLFLVWLRIRAHTQALAIMGTFVGVLALLATVVSISVAHSDASPNASPQTSEPLAVVVPTTVASSASTVSESAGVRPSPLRFTGPTPGEHVGKHPLVTLDGDVPEGRRLWILVRSGQELFVQGPAEETVQGWSFRGVTLGDDKNEDIGLSYTIMAVLADPEADAKLLESANQTGGDKPVRLPPGTTPGPKVIVERVK